MIARSVPHVRSDGGFALMEALVAAAIFALLIAGLHQGLAVGWRSLRTANAEIAAVALLSRELANAGTGTPLEEGQSSGTTPEGLHWQRTIRARELRETSAGSPLFNGYWVSVTVRWREGGIGNERALGATTLKIRRWRG